MNLEKLIIATSPLTGAIYVGYSTDGGKTYKDKIEVTKQAVDAVMMHMGITQKEYECKAGELTFKPREEAHE